MAAMDTMNDVLTWMSDTAVRWLEGAWSFLLGLASIAFHIVLLVLLF